MRRLVLGLLLCTGISQAGPLLLEASGVFSAGTPVTPYSQAGQSFFLSIVMDSDPEVLDFFPPDATLVSVGEWNYSVAGTTLASGASGMAYFYFASKGGLFDLCTDPSCSNTVGFAGEALISSLLAPSLSLGVYTGTDFTFYDGFDLTLFATDSAVTISPVPEPATWLTFACAASVCWIFRTRLAQFAGQ